MVLSYNHRDEDYPFPVLLGEDFAQILPAIRRESQVKVVAACLQRTAYLLASTYYLLATVGSFKVTAVRINNVELSILSSARSTSALSDYLHVPQRFL